MHRKSCQDVTELSHTSQYENITDIIFWNKDVTEYFVWFWLDTSCLLLITAIVASSPVSSGTWVFDWLTANQMRIYLSMTKPIAWSQRSLVYTVVCLLLFNCTMETSCSADIILIWLFSLRAFLRIFTSQG